MSLAQVKAGQKNMRGQVRYLTPEEVSKLEACCSSPEDALLVRLLFQTGARISEVLALRPYDIDYEHQRLELPALKRKDATTKLVVVNPATLDRLKEFVKGKKKDRRLFRVTRQQAYYIVRMAAKKAGLGRVHPHTLRDSLAVNWALAGGNLNLLQRQLGHRSFATTVDRYLTFSSEDIRKEYNRVLTKE